MGQSTARRELRSGRVRVKSMAMLWPHGFSCLRLAVRGRWGRAGTGKRLGPQVQLCFHYYLCAHVQMTTVL